MLSWQVGARKHDVSAMVSAFPRLALRREGDANLREQQLDGKGVRHVHCASTYLVFFVNVYHQSLTLTSVCLSVLVFVIVYCLTEKHCFPVNV